MSWASKFLVSNPRYSHPRVEFAGWHRKGGVPSTEAPHPQVDAQLLTVQKLEEKERALQGSLGGVEKELTLRSQALELNKRKVRKGRGHQLTPFPSDSA